MERINRILRHRLFTGALRQIEELEEDRIYCGHDLEHLLSVARMAYIENLEERLGIEKELIYAAALLHDIGRGLEYTEAIPHEEASCALGQTILRDCGFGQREIETVLVAIKGHRKGGAEVCFTEKNDETERTKRLSALLYRADKASRNCYYCKQAEQGCNWSAAKRNRGIER